MKRAKPNREQGFSLVETVAAMGVLALAAVPLMQLTGDATRNTARLESRLLARTVAENVMARTMATPTVLDAGVATGEEKQMARDYTWTRLAGPAVPGGLQTFEVTVTEKGASQIQARLVSLRAIAMPLPDSSETSAPGGADQ